MTFSPEAEGGMPHCLVLAETAFSFAVDIEFFIPHCFQLASTAFSFAFVNTIFADGLSPMLPSRHRSTASPRVTAAPLAGAATVTLVSLLLVVSGTDKSGKGAGELNHETNF
jgi:hypothetical protein